MTGSARRRDVEHIANLDTPGVNSSCAASISEAIRYRPCAEPGAADVMFVPNWTEHAEPGAW